MTAIAATFFDQPWAATGNCVGEAPELFFPTEYDDAHPGRTICSTCPALRECLRYAVDNEPHGLWGGATEKQRDAFRNGLTAGINQCDHCPTQWVGRAALRHHMNVDHAAELYPHLCSCGRRFGTSHGMRSHAGKTHPEVTA